MRQLASSQLFLVGPRVAPEKNTAIQHPIARILELRCCSGGSPAWLCGGDDEVAGEARLKQARTFRVP